MIQPLKDRIAVRPSAMRDDITSAGIVVAASKGIIESQRQFGRQGFVAAVGPEVSSLRVGDRVLWGEFDFPRYDDSGETLVILQEADITAVVE